MRSQGYCTFIEVPTMALLRVWNGFLVSRYCLVQVMTIVLRYVPLFCIMLSSQHSNIVLISMQQWLFDSPTEPPRLLKFRGGHQAPPHLVRYYGNDGKQLLTASRDRSLRCTSVVRDSRSFELSQGTNLPNSKRQCF